MTRPGDGSAEDDARRVIEEATRLIAALGASSEEHTGPGCRACPLCRLIAAFRGLRPEVVEHLAAAGEELLAAARQFAASRGAGTGAAPDGAPEDRAARTPAGAGEDVPRARPVVQHIDITD